MKTTRRLSAAYDARLAEGGGQLAILIDRRSMLCLGLIQSRTGETKTQIVERLLWLGADTAHDDTRPE